MRHDEKGFSLIEVLVASGILATGLLSLAGVYVIGLQHLRSSTPGLIAREKAREAVESVHTARDMRVIEWNDIRNVADTGVFLDGEQPLAAPGPDGLVNTADDDGVESIISAGIDGLLGSADDIATPLTDYTREIAITELLDEDAVVLENLRQIRVTVKFKVGDLWRSYTLTTYISSYS